MCFRYCWILRWYIVSLLVGPFASFSHAETPAVGATRLREYFIAAELIWWDYAPLGYNGCSGKKWDDAPADGRRYAIDGIGSKYLKAVFREYEPGFTVRFSCNTCMDRPYEFLGLQTRYQTYDVSGIRDLARTAR